MCKELEGALPVLCGLWALLAGLGGSLPLYAQDCSSRHVISPRVGGTIESEERDYFGLFPRVSRFQSAVAYRCADSTGSFTVNRLDEHGSRVEETVPVGAKTLDELADYIDRFEEVYRDTEHVDWGLIFGVARPVPQMPQGVRLHVVATDGREYSGRLLHVGERALVVSPASSDAFNARESALLRPREVEYVHVEKPFVQRLVAENFSVVAGDATVFREGVVEMLRSHARYHRALSPELREYIESADRVDRGTEEEYDPSLVRSAYRNELRTRLRVSFSTRLFHFATHESSYSTDLSIYTYDFGKRKASYRFPRFGLTANVALTRQFGMEANIALARPFASSIAEETYETYVSGETFEAREALFDLGSVEVAFSFVEGMVYYVIKPIDLLDFGSSASGAVYRKLQLQLGLGLSYSAIEQVTEVVASGRATVDRYVVFGERSVSRDGGMGGVFSIGASSYITRHLSFNLSTRLRTLPSFRVEDLTIENPSGLNHPVKTLRGFRQPTSVMAEVLWGIAMHF